MKKRIPFTEPYTPAEAAELAASMKESETRMRANAIRLMDERFTRIWAGPDHEAACESEGQSPQ